MKKIRFIHAADLHLDSPFVGLKDIPDPLLKQARESTFTAFQTLLQHAIYEKVDFVILAGDLFDGENRSLKAQSHLKKGMELLADYQIPCYIIHGNHDHLNGNWISLTWPKNVFFFKDEVTYVQFSKNNIVANLYGFSYPEKSVKENIAQKYDKHGVADFHIGILHGTADGQEGHDCYAPFHIKQLVEKEFDYWALGHIHKREILHKDPYICYSGNIQGRHKKEVGEKGVYLVEINELKQTNIQFLATSKIIWQELDVPIDSFKKVDELKSHCETVLEELKMSGCGTFVILKFSGSGVLHEFLTESVEELIEALNIGQEKQLSFVYVIDRKIDTTGHWDRNALKNEEHFIKDILLAVDHLSNNPESLQSFLNEVYNNTKIKRYLEPLSEEEKQDLLREAESYILTLLLKERSE